MGTETLNVFSAAIVHSLMVFSFHYLFDLVTHGPDTHEACQAHGFQLVQPHSEFCVLGGKGCYSCKGKDFFDSHNWEIKKD